MSLVKVVNRRFFVSLSGAFSGSLAIALMSDAASASDVTNNKTTSGSNDWPTSQNGWPIEETVDGGGNISKVSIEGTPLEVAMRLGEVTIILTHVIRRYHYEIDALLFGEVEGFKYPSADALRTDGNHCSGTAIDIRPEWYPRGSFGGYSDREKSIIKSILSDCEGVVVWGGFEDSNDESHFEIAVGPDDSLLFAVADKLRHWSATAGLGAGSLLI